MTYRRPLTLNREFAGKSLATYTVEKFGPGRWAVLADGRFYVRADTKAKAEAACVRFAASDREAIAFEAEAQALRMAVVESYLALRAGRPVQLRLF